MKKKTIVPQIRLLLLMIYIIFEIWRKNPGRGWARAMVSKRRRGARTVSKGTKNEGEEEGEQAKDKKKKKTK